MKSAIARDLSTSYESALIHSFLTTARSWTQNSKLPTLLTEFELQAEVIYPSDTSNAQCDPVSPSASDSATSFGDAAPPKNKESKRSRSHFSCNTKKESSKKSLSLG